MITTLKESIARRSRARRSQLFFSALKPDPDALVVDLGGGKGRHMARFYSALKNVCIVDYNEESLAYAASKFGFQTRMVDGTERLPFEDKEVDIIFCSSVIEHVTGPKEDAVARFKRDGQDFSRQAFDYQKRFADEIRRCGKGYFVQTPNRLFPVEVHSWLPMLGYLPTHVQWSIMRVTNHFWPRKDDAPDWNLLDEQQMRAYFPDAEFHIERWMGIPKSIIAVKRP